MLNIDIDMLRKLNEALQSKLREEQLIVQGMLPETGFAGEGVPPSLS